MNKKKSKIKLKGRIVTPLAIIDGVLSVMDGRIIDIQQDAEVTAETLDFGTDLIVPGFIDIHLHGVGPYKMQSEDHLVHASKLLLKYGTTGFFPTLANVSIQGYLDFTHSVVAAQKRIGTNGASLLAAHFEGPFINPLKKGGMHEGYLQKISIDICSQFTQTGAVGYLTLSPELTGSTEAIRYLTERKVVVSLGHTAASNEEVLAASAAGAKSVCHLYNTFSRTGEDEPGVWTPGLVEYLLDNNKFFCEIICDMVHVRREYIRLAEAMLRPYRFIAITDSMTGAGLPAGEYTMSDGRWFTTHTGAGRLRDEPLKNGIVGSVLTMNKAFANLIEICGFDAVSAVRYTSTNAARLFGLENDIGRIAVGNKADLAVLNKNYDCTAVFVEGELRYEL